MPLSPTKDMGSQSLLISSHTPCDQYSWVYMAGVLSAHNGRREVTFETLFVEQGSDKHERTSQFHTLD